MTKKERKKKFAGVLLQCLSLSFFTLLVPFLSHSLCYLYTTQAIWIFIDFSLNENLFYCGATTTNKWKKDFHTRYKFSLFLFSVVSKKELGTFVISFEEFLQDLLEITLYRILVNLVIESFKGKEVLSKFCRI